MPGCDSVDEASSVGEVEFRDLDICDSFGGKEVWIDVIQPADYPEVSVYATNTGGVYYSPRDNTSVDEQSFIWTVSCVHGDDDTVAFRNSSHGTWLTARGQHVQVNATAGPCPNQSPFFRAHNVDGRPLWWEFESLLDTDTGTAGWLYANLRMGNAPGPVVTNAGEYRAGFGKFELTLLQQ